MNRPTLRDERVVYLFGRRLRAVSVVILALTSAAAACSGAGQQQDDHPNLLLITVDTLRADHLDAYGYLRATALAVAEFASEVRRAVRASRISGAVDVAQHGFGAFLPVSQRRWCTTLRLRRGSCRLSGHGDRCGCTIST